jgi:thiol-disulfide isomerase/thioredoxin
MSLTKFAGTIAMMLFALNQARAEGPTLQTLWVPIAKRVQAKIDAGKTSESDFTNELADWDKLISTLDRDKTNQIAFLIYQQADFYLTLFHDLEKSEPLYRKVSQEYPGYQLAGQAAEQADGLEHELAAKRIHDSLTPGTVFPDFAERDLDGKSLSVSNYTGKVVLVDFWATWCPRCVIEMPAIVKLYQAQHGQGLEIIGVCLNKTEERDQLAAYLKKNSGMKWPQYFDGLYWANKLAVKYGVIETPSNILIGRDGKIIGIDLHDTDLKNAITKALGS